MSSKKATIKDIARLAEVSDTTVSLSFQENSRISKATKKRVLQIAKKLNYSPNLTARKLRHGLTKTIGFVVTDITNPFYSRMMRTAEQIAAEQEYQVLFYDSDWNPHKEIEIIENMISNRVQGILICFCEKTQKSYQLIKKSDIPYIAIDTRPQFYSGPFVINDLFMAGYMAAEHLVDVGCQHCAFFDAGADIHNYSSFIELKKGFKHYLRKKKITFRKTDIITAGLSIESGKKAFNALFKEPVEVDGIFCVDDLCSFGVIEAAEEKGFIIGKDIALIGIDNLEVSSISRISLSSIHQPYDRLVKSAMSALLESIEKDIHPRIREVIEPRLVERDSTKLKSVL